MAVKLVFEAVKLGSEGVNLSSSVNNCHSLPFYWIGDCFGTLIPWIDLGLFFAIAFIIFLSLLSDLV